MLNTLFKSVYSYFIRLIDESRAGASKKRSVRALEKLDDRLLEDIGLCRSAVGDIVPMASGVRSNASKIKQLVGANTEQIINKRLYFARRRL